MVRPHPYNNILTFVPPLLPILYTITSNALLAIIYLGAQLRFSDCNGPDALERPESCYKYGVADCCCAQWINGAGDASG